MTPRTTRQPRAQCVNRVHNASTSSTTRQPQAQRVNREHNASTASTTRQLQAQRVNRKHNASTASTARQLGAQRVARARPGCTTCCSRTSRVRNALPASTMHRPAFTMRQPACNNNNAVHPWLLCVVSRVVESNDASTAGMTRQPPRERRVNRGNDTSTVCTMRRPCTRRFPLSPLCSPCESDSEQ